MWRGVLAGPGRKRRRPKPRGDWGGFARRQPRGALTEQARKKSLEGKASTAWSALAVAGTIGSIKSPRAICKLFAQPRIGVVNCRNFCYSFVKIFCGVSRVSPRQNPPGKRAFRSHALSKRDTGGRPGQAGCKPCLECTGHGAERPFGFAPTFPGGFCARSYFIPRPAGTDARPDHATACPAATAQIY